MFYLLAIAPAVVILVSLIALASRSDEHQFILILAGIGCVIAAATPWVSLWYTASVLKDPTAIIGAGLLAIGQVVIAPLGTLLGGGCGLLVRAALGKR